MEDTLSRAHSVKKCLEAQGVEVVHPRRSFSAYVNKELSDVQIIIDILDHQQKHGNWDLLDDIYEQLEANDAVDPALLETDSFYQSGQDSGLKSSRRAAAQDSKFWRRLEIIESDHEGAPEGDAVIVKLS